MFNSRGRPIVAKCNICRKGPMFGHNRSHALNATRRQFKPNLTKRHVKVDGKEINAKICNRCIRTLEKQGRLQAIVRA